MSDSEHKGGVPLALRPDDAAAALGISRSSLEKLVKAKKIRPPVSIDGLRGVVLYDRKWLSADWQALRDEASDGRGNEWDAS